MGWQALLGPLIGAGATIGSSFLGGGGGGSNTARDIAEANAMNVARALDALTRYWRTGTFGHRKGPGVYTAGEAYTGSLGDFNLTDLQKVSLDKLTGLLGGGLSPTYEQGKDFLSEFVSKAYDPASSDLYKGFRTNVMREKGDALDQLKREMAFTGDLYSTETAKQTGLLGERTQQSLQNKLAELADTNVLRRLGAAEDLTQLGLQEEDVLTKRIGLGMSLGDIERQLRTMEAQAKYDEYKRQRSEWYDVVNTAKGVAGMASSTLGGLTSMQNRGTNPFTNLLNQGLALAGEGIGKFMGNINWGGSSGSDGASTDTLSKALYQGVDYSLSSSPLLASYLW